MFGINPLNGVKKPFFRPEKWHGFGPPFYYDRHTRDSYQQDDLCDANTYLQAQQEMKTAAEREKSDRRLEPGGPATRPC